MTTNSRHLHRGGALLLVLGLVTSLVGILSPAGADGGDAPVVTLEDGVDGCMGVRTTPGSENTTKRLDPSYPSDFNPGGIVGYIIDYPVDPADVAGRTTFVITDCVFVNDTPVAKYTVSFVPNTEAYELRLAAPIAPGTPLGAQFCNYAKTTAAPSESQASNRKAGPSCFTVGGSLRIEKRSGSATGPLLPGASFSVVCAPSVAEPATIITGLSQTSQTDPDGTVSASGTSVTGTIAIVGPSGTPCTVTETAAPPGYQLDPTPRHLVIPVGASQTVDVFVNRQLGDLVVTKATSGGTGTFTFDVNCDGTAFDRSFTITDSGSERIAGIPTGTSCTVTEVADGRFTSTVVPGDGTVTVALGDNTVAFTNARNTGNLTIVKTTSGGAGTFTFDVDCDGAAFDRLGGNPVVVTGSGSQTVMGIPTGTSCTVSERANPLFSSVVVPPNGTVVIDGDGETVAFTNTRITGSLTVDKATTGGTGTFTFDVDCSDDAFDQTFTITDSGARTISGIPTTTTCTVTERSDALFDSVVVPAGGNVAITAGGQAVSFTNTARPSAITLDKKVNGADHATAGDALVVHAGDTLRYTVTITNTGEIPLTLVSLTDSLLPGFAGTCSQGLGSTVAAGGSVTCAYELVATADVTNVASVTGLDGHGRRPTAADATFVDVISPAVAITKTASPEVVTDSGDVTYTYVVTNTGDTPLGNVTVTDDVLGAIGIVATLAPGASVTLSRTVAVDTTSPTRNVGTAVATDVLNGEVRASAVADITVVLGVVTELPRTGAPLRLLATTGLAVSLLGLALLLAGRRRAA